MTTELRGKSAIVGTGHAGLGEAHGLTAYDAMYLDLAIRLGADLATLDAALRRAALAEGIVVV